MRRSPFLDRVLEGISAQEPLTVSGRVLKVAGLVVEATLPRVAVGTACEIVAPDGRRVQAEVVGFLGARALLMPFGEVQGLAEGSLVLPLESGAQVSVGDALLGRVVDAGMKPIDGGPSLLLSRKVPLQAAPPSAMARRRISAPLPMGVRCLDALLTVGEGQRVGIMAGPGVGKSVLLGMVARHAQADVIVCALIGERGREVREFVERDLGPALSRSVVVVATADEPPLLRLRAGMAATAVAEHFRSQGKKVMLLMDSLSRVAMAQREIGLSAGEPPTSKGYPPSVFAILPRLLERAGNDQGQGSITGLYTVLAEGDDLSDPVADAARAALDGHIVLSRKLAGAGHFPAVDVLGSVSRVMTEVTSRAHQDLAGGAREVLSTWKEFRDLVDVGAYVRGSNPKVERAIQCAPALEAFLRQPPEERTPLHDALAGLKAALTPAAPPASKELRRG